MPIGQLVPELGDSVEGVFLGQLGQKKKKKKKIQKKLVSANLDFGESVRNGQKAHVDYVSVTAIQISGPSRIPTYIRVYVYVYT
jgi:hypothetical protein